MTRRFRRPARSVALTAAIGATLVAAVTVLPSTASATRASVYVALGDSYTSGPLIPPQTDPVTCLRSGENYPARVARARHVTTFRDASCSGATTKDFAAPQKGTISGTNPAQYRALSKDTTLVTVGIGGNDIGLVGLAESCINLTPGGTSCAATNTAGGKDVYAARIRAFAPTYGTVIEQIRARAPHARIVLVGYPYAIRTGGCYPVQPLYAADATYIQARIDQLNHVMRVQASHHHASYVDIRTSSVGHDACAIPGVRWTEGLVPLNAAAPLHPNILGMRNAAARVLARLTSPTGS